MTRLTVPVVIATILLMWVVSPLFAASPDWPRWRGAAGNSISAETGWDPQALDVEDPVLWKTDVGLGFSAVSISGDYLYTMGNDRKNDTVWCLEVETGKVVWSHSYPCGNTDYPGPRSTPTVDGGFVYTVSNEGHVVCLDAKKGTLVWKKHLRTDFGASAPTWGFATSVVAEGDLLYLNANSYGLALNRKNGARVWSSPAGTCGYSTPVLYTDGKTKGVVLFGQNAVYGVNSENGTLLWQYPWRTGYDVNAADPIVTDGKVFVSSNYGVGSGLIGIKNNKPQLVYENKVFKSHFHSFVLDGGLVYGNDGSPGSGALKCMELSTGKELWSERLGFCSLVAAGNYLVIFTERGKLVITEKSGASYKEVARANILKGTCWTPPVLCRGLVFVRSSRGEIAAVNIKKKAG